MSNAGREVIIIGGGLAGLIAAAWLAARDRKVTLLEKQHYPFHKVCGEYISAEVLPFLRSMDMDPNTRWELPQISRLQLTTTSGKRVETRLDSGGFGISRYRLDEFFVQQARQRGAEIRQASLVTRVESMENGGRVHTAGGEVLEAPVIIGAFGKHSNIDRLLSRPFFLQRSPYIGVKHHFRFPVPADLVSLHNFPGGYCGVSAVEDGITNVCYLTTQDNLRRSGDISAMEQTVLSRNPYLKEIWQQGEKLFAEPKVISQVSFLPKQPVEEHILMVGDAAGLIAPLAGNGMAMAMHSGAMAASWTLRYLRGEISRTALEQGYGTEWKAHFRSRLHTGNRLQHLFGRSLVSAVSLSFFGMFPFLLHRTIHRTHGKPFSIHA